MNDSIFKAYLQIIQESATAKEIPDDADFEKEINDAIQSKTLVKFKYTKKDGTQFPMTVLPFTMITLAGKPAVKAYLYGQTDKERTLYLSSMGNGGNAIPKSPIEQKEEEEAPSDGIRTLEDDIKNQLYKAIESKEKVALYVKKRIQVKEGRKSNWYSDVERRVILPVKLDEDYDDHDLWWVTCYEDGIEDEAHKKTISSSDILDSRKVKYYKYTPRQLDKNVSYEKTPEMEAVISLGLEKLYEAQSSFKDPEHPYFYCKKDKLIEPICKELDETYLFFKPVGYSSETGKLVLECHPAKEREKSYDDGDYDDGRGHSWTDHFLDRWPLDDISGYIWGELKDGKIAAYNGAELEHMLSTGIRKTWTTNDRWSKPYRYFNGRRRW